LAPPAQQVAVFPDRRALAFATRRRNEWISAFDFAPKGLSANVRLDVVPGTMKQWVFRTCTYLRVFRRIYRQTCQGTAK